MNILVCCEESQRVCIEFRKRGHRAFSCDIQEPSGGHPEWHIMGDVIPLIDGDCKFFTVDGVEHKQVGKWDMLIAFPPCTYLSNAGAVRLFDRPGVINKKRYAKGVEGKKFFLRFYFAKCQKIAIENPVPSSCFNLPHYTQIIQPYWFGHPYSKKTCLWLKNLAQLQPTEMVRDAVIPWVSGGSKDKNGNPRNKIGQQHDQKQRSKTFLGIASAMADQWGAEEQTYQMSLFDMEVFK